MADLGLKHEAPVSYWQYMHFALASLLQCYGAILGANPILTIGDFGKKIPGPVAMAIVPAQFADWVVVCEESHIGGAHSKTTQASTHSGRENCIC